MRTKPINDPDAKILEILARIESRLDRIEAAVYGSDTGKDAALAEAIAAAAAGLPFTVADLIEHAEIVFDETPTLRKAMAAALSQVNARVLGRWLADREGGSGAVRFVRVGEKRGAVLWQCESGKSLTRRVSDTDSA